MAEQRLYYGLRQTILPRLPATVDHGAGQYDLYWLDVPITPAAPTQDILPTAASRYDLRWLDVDFAVAGPTENMLMTAPAELLLKWLDVDIEPAGPTSATLTLIPSQLDMRWLDVDIEAAGATSAIVSLAPAELTLRWLDAPIISDLGSGAACVDAGSWIEAPQWPARQLVNFAMGGWFQVDNLNGGALITKWDFPGNIEFLLSVNASTMEFTVAIDGSIEFVDRAWPGAGLQPDTWYFAYAERRNNELRIGIGTADDPPQLTTKPASSGATNITGVNGRFGASSVSGTLANFLDGRFDDWSFWRDTPNVDPTRLWSVGYEDLAPAEKTNLASWWKFDDDGAGIWRDENETFDLDSKPTPTSVSQCGGRPFTLPSETTCPVQPAELDLTWLDVTFLVEGTTEASLDVLPADFVIGWLDVQLTPGGETSDTVLYEPAELDLKWLDVDLETGGADDFTIFLAPAEYTIRWLDVDVTGPAPLDAILDYLPAELGLRWLDSDFDVGGLPPTQDILATSIAEYDLRWLSVANFEIGAPTADILMPEPVQYDLRWIDTAPVEVGQPDDAVLDVAPARYDLAWLDSVQFEVEGPDDAIVDHFASQYDLRWLDVNIVPESGLAPGVCFSGSTNSFMQRNLPNKQAGSLGFQTGVNSGFLSVWTESEFPPDQPNAGFVFGGTGDGDIRLQMGFTADPLTSDVFAYFEIDDGSGAFGTITAQSVTAIALNAGKNHHAFGYDPARVSENGGGWVYWLNGQEVLMELGNLQWPGGGWFGQAQSQTLMRHLTIAANMNSGIITDPFAVCMYQMVMRGNVTLNQAQVDFWYNNGSGTLTSEVNWPSGPTANDYGWPLSGPGFGDEVWGDGSVGRDTTGFFTAANPTPDPNGIPGRGAPATPPDLA